MTEQRSEVVTECIERLKGLRGEFEQEARTPMVASTAEAMRTTETLKRIEPLLSVLMRIESHDKAVAMNDIIDATKERNEAAKGRRRDLG